MHPQSLCHVFVSLHDSGPPAVELWKVRSGTCRAHCLSRVRLRASGCERLLDYVWQMEGEPSNNLGWKVHGWQSADVETAHGWLLARGGRMYGYESHLYGTRHDQWNGLVEEVGAREGRQAAAQAGHKWMGRDLQVGDGHVLY